MAKISHDGLPYSVATTAKLPDAGYIGYTCLVEGTGVLAVKTASGYAPVNKPKTYATTSAFPTTHTAGMLLFCTADNSLYLDNGTAYKKVTVAT